MHTLRPPNFVRFSGGGYKQPRQRFFKSDFPKCSYFICLQNVRVIFGRRWLLTQASNRGILKEENCHVLFLWWQEWWKYLGCQLETRSAGDAGSLNTLGGWTMLARPASAKQIKRVTSLFGEFCKICYFRTGRELSRVSFRKDFWDRNLGRASQLSANFVSPCPR